MKKQVFVFGFPPQATSVRRHRLALLLLILPGLLELSCKPAFPDKPTIVTGRITDENRVPVKGVTLSLKGYKRLSLSGAVVFNETTTTDGKGTYQFSKVISREADWVNLLPQDNTLFRWGRTHNIFLEVDGKYVQLGSPVPVEKKKYGETSTVNFQVRKR